MVSENASKHKNGRHRSVCHFSFGLFAQSTKDFLNLCQMRCSKTYAFFFGDRYINMAFCSNGCLTNGSLKRLDLSVLYFAGVGQSDRLKILAALQTQCNSGLVEVILGFSNNIIHFHVNVNEYLSQVLANI